MSKELAVISAEAVSDVLARLGNRNDLPSRALAQAQVQDARARGELAQVLAFAPDGRGLELLLDANDHDETSQGALANLPDQRQLADYLAATEQDGMLWDLAPARTVVGTLLKEALDAAEDLLPDPPDREPLGEERLPPLDAGADLDDADEDEFDDEEAEMLAEEAPPAFDPLPAAAHFLVEFRQRFERVFGRRPDGLPGRPDREAALDVAFGNAFSFSVRRLLDETPEAFVEVLSGPDEAFLLEDACEDWTADLLGERKVAAAPHRDTVPDAAPGTAPADDLGDVFE